MDLSFPIGKWQKPEAISSADRQRLIAVIAAAPDQFRAAVQGLNDKQLDTPYRPSGWTVRQVIHHIPDSHMNSYLRMKFAVTENDPLVKAYDEAVWARLHDASTMRLEPSLQMISGLHARWSDFLGSLTEAEWARAFVHSENGPMRVDIALSLYAWHSQHHAAHITRLREREGW